MILQLNPPIQVMTPLGQGMALLVIDYGPSVNTVWAVHQFGGGRLVHVDSPDIRIMGNAMYGIPDPKRPPCQGLRNAPISPVTAQHHPV